VVSESSDPRGPRATGTRGLSAPRAWKGRRAVNATFGSWLARALAMIGRAVGKGEGKLDSGYLSFIYLQARRGGIFRLCWRVAEDSRSSTIGSN
jgi:hypothetical protein